MGLRPLRKLLIANRGDVASRVMRTAASPMRSRSAWFSAGDGLSSMIF